MPYIIVYVAVSMHILASKARGWDVDTASLVYTHYSTIFFLGLLDLGSKTFFCMFVDSTTFPCSLASRWIENVWKLDCFIKQIYRCNRVCSISVLGDPSDQSKESSEMIQYQQQSRRTVNGKMYEEICADSANNDIS